MKRALVPLLVGLSALGIGFALGRAGSERPAPGAAAEAPSPVHAPVEERGAAALALAQADPGDSLVFYPFMNLSKPSEQAVATGGLLILGLQGDRARLEEALETYRRLELEENFGGEYPTLRWICEYELASPEQRRTMLTNPDGRRLVELFGRDDWALLREYLDAKYGLSPMDRDRQWYLDEIVRFNSPYRAEWEHTDRVLELLDLQPGAHVVDVGAGAGFYSYRFAERVGDEGQVYALEMNELHLQYIREVAAREGLQRLAAIPTDGAFPALDDGTLDRIFLCATYQTLYLSLRAPEREAWLAAALRALKPGGLLVVAENEPVLPDDVVPFGGISVSRPLLEAQLLAHGFELVQAEYVVPQRYVLVLRKPLQAGTTTPGR